MISIAKLERNIEAVQTILERDRQRLARDPKNLLLKTTVRSAEYEIGELYKALESAKLERHVEVIELRFKGHDVDLGTMPVKLLSKLSDFFYAAIMSSSAKYKTGKEVLSRIPKSLSEHIDLRISDMAYGSTRIVLTGKTNPDIFGYSVLEEALDNLFQILSAERYSEVDGYVANLGLKGARGLADFLDRLLKDHVELELTWDTPYCELKQWSASREEIERVLSRLKHTELNTPQEVLVEGTIKTLSENGRIVIRTIDDKTINIRFSKSQYMMVVASKASLGERRKFMCDKQTVFNSATDKSIDIYTLISIQ